MELNELLALLPDNNTGAIDAADLRTIVTELYGQSQTVGQVFGFTWQASTTNPSNGRATMDPTWGLNGTTLRLNNTTDSGLTLTFDVLDSLLDVRLVLVGANDSVLHATKTGPSVNQGTYRDIPIAVQSATGSPPINNEKVSVVVRGVLP